MNFFIDLGVQDVGILLDATEVFLISQMVVDIYGMQMWDILEYMPCDLPLYTQGRSRGALFVFNQVPTAPFRTTAGH
jgi:hypothetical protein